MANNYDCVEMYGSLINDVKTYNFFALLQFATYSITLKIYGHTKASLNVHGMHFEAILTYGKH